VTDFGVPLADQNQTLAELLKKQVYETAAFIGSLVLESKEFALGLDRGFDSYVVVQTHLLAISRCQNEVGHQVAAGRRTLGCRYFCASNLRLQHGNNPSVIEAAAVLAGNHLHLLLIKDDVVDQGVSQLECPIRLAVLRQELIQKPLLLFPGFGTVQNLDWPKYNHARVHQS
jgi:hypothetical protein